MAELFLPSDSISKTLSEAEKLISINLTKIELQWVQVLSEGWASPLKGFMRENQYLQCLHFNALKTPFGSWVSQSLAIVLALDEAKKSEVEGKDAIALRYENKIVGVLRNIEVFPHRKEERIARQFGTSHSDHPYVKVRDLTSRNSGQYIKIVENLINIRRFQIKQLFIDSKK